MRTSTERKLTHTHAKKPGHLHVIRPRSIKRIYTSSLRNIRKKPLISLSAAAVALSAISGLVFWYGIKNKKTVD